jgi:hypothetical protein
MKNLRAIFCVFLFVVAAGLLTSCATDNPDDISQVPWNQPASWEGPMPSTINQGR